MSNGWSKVKNLFWQTEEVESDADELGTILEPLRDLPGVLGSLVVDWSGSVRASDLPRVFDEASLGEVGERMLELHSVLAEEHDPVVGTLEFAGHCFHVKKLECGMIGVLMDDTASKPALSMALNLVSRRVASTLAPAAGP